MGASGRGLSAPRPALPTPNAQAATAHLPSSSPSSERSGPWHGYAERRDGDLSGAGFVRAAGRSDAAGAADLRGPPQDGPTTAGPDAGDRVWHDQQGAGAGTSGAEATSKVTRGVTAATAGLPVAQRAEAQA